MHRRAIVRGAQGASPHRIAGGIALDAPGVTGTHSRRICPPQDWHHSRIRNPDDMSTSPSQPRLAPAAGALAPGVVDLSSPRLVTFESVREHPRVKTYVRAAD